MELKEIDELIEILKTYPGINHRQAQKIIYFLLEQNPEQNDNQFNQFKTILKQIKKCNICKNYTIDFLCSICASQDRSKKLMVVENSVQIRNYEEWKYFDGKYFQIPFLFNKRFEKIQNVDLSFFMDYVNNFEEIILAISPTAEGILTTNYLYEQIKNKNPKIKITKLATGIQMGASIDYADKLTIFHALKNRKEIE